MSNIQSLCTSFKVDILNGVHAFSAATGGKVSADVFKGALFTQASSLGATTTSYTGATTEVSGAGYTTGGNAITNATAPTSASNTAYWTPSASIVWTGTTLSTVFDSVLIYNSTVAGNNAVGVFTFGAQLVTSGNFTLTMPTNNSTTGLIRLT